MGSTLSLVMKVSKYCNLRCGYCYEFNELADKRRMPLDLAARIFEDVRRSVPDLGAARLSFIWHGGEPFLLPPDYYRELGDRQRAAFGDLAYENSVQTNLTVLTERHLALLGEGGFFDGIGVSFDGYGDQRVDTQGRQRTAAVLANMETLIERGIPFGVITVLARNTLPHVEACYRFYDEIGVSSRFLAYYKQADERQSAVHAITFDELVGAYRTLFDAWAGSRTATPVDPVDGLLATALRVIDGKSRQAYRPLEDEHAFLVNPNGDVWGEADCYRPGYRYGSLAVSSIVEVLASPTRRRAAAEASSRVAEVCSSCPFYGYCTGEPVASATPAQREMLARSGCPTRAMLAYTVDRLERDEGVAAEIGGVVTHNLGSRSSDGSAALLPA